MEKLLAGKKLGIYIHVPFCIAKCKYCDFLSFPTDDDTKEAYFLGLEEEIKNFAGQHGKDYRICSVFFGGGTPSTVNSIFIGRIMELLYKLFEFEDDVEITIEANPKTVDFVKLKAYRSCGINRLSFGVQSANDDELKKIGRVHTYGDFLKSYEAALKAGFTNINVDIMSAIPGQTLKSYEHTLKEIVKLRTKHVSAYSLILEEGTPLYDEYQRGENLFLPDEDTEREMYYITEDYLNRVGLARYEISNYAKTGFESRHNSMYWTGGDYAGFGIGAASLVKGNRYTNTSSIKEYIDNPLCDKTDITELSEKDKISEFMFLGLRMMAGVSFDEFKNRFSRHMESVYGDVIDKYIGLGLLEKNENRLMLTRKGIDVSNTIFADFLLE